MFSDDSLLHNLDCLNDISSEDAMSLIESVNSSPQYEIDETVHLEVDKAKHWMFD